MRTFHLLNGDTISVHVPDDVALFLERLDSAVHDPSIADDQVFNWVHGCENPMLTEDLFPGQRKLTGEVSRHPLFFVMWDFIQRKRVASGTLDLDALNARHSLSVAEAGNELGVSMKSLRKAIHGGRIPALRRDGQWFLDPDTVERYCVVLRGPATDAHARTGHDGRGHTLHIATDGQVTVLARWSSIVEKQISGWSRIFVRTIEKGDGERDTSRFYELAAGGAHEPVRLDALEVTGRFKVVRHVRNSRAALEAWEQVRRELPPSAEVEQEPVATRPVTPPHRPDFTVADLFGERVAQRREPLFPLDDD